MGKSITLQNDSFILWKISGKLEKQYTEDSLWEIAQINSERTPKLPILVDIRELTNISMSARKIGINWLNEGHTPRIAVYGATAFVAFIVQKIIVVAPMQGRFKLFKQEQEAIDWLLKKL